MITVKELIEFLQTQPQNLLVGYKIYSEQCLLELEDMQIKELCAPREDGWIQNRRPDMATQLYLIFPGN